MFQNHSTTKWCCFVTMFVNFLLLSNIMVSAVIRNFSEYTEIIMLNSPAMEHRARFSLVVTTRFCHAMLCISAAYAVVLCPSVCPSSYLSRSCILLKWVNISKIFSPSGSHTILVFSYFTSQQYGNGDHLNWIKNRDFDPYLSLG